jgi:hypothetical protein
MQPTIRSFPVPKDVQDAITEALENGRREREFERKLQASFAAGLWIGMLMGVTISFLTALVRCLL